MNRRPTTLSLAVAFLLLLPLPCVRASDAATLIFRKIFKSSSPEYVEIKISEGGAGTYDIRQLDETPNPQNFHVGSSLAAKMFALAGQLNHFRGLRLDVRRRIANLGQKTFRYERGAESYETTFNYTLDANATELLQIFEGLSREQQHIDLLERTMRYDRLGVNDALMQLETDLNHKLLPEPERLLTILDQIAADSRFVDIARQRARTLATSIRNPH